MVAGTLLHALESSTPFTSTTSTIIYLFPQYHPIQFLPPMRGSKRKQNDDQQTMDVTTKNRRTTTNQADQVSDVITTLAPPRRSGRVPKDGAAKRADIERAIRPDLYPDPKQPSTRGAIANPESMSKNPMAPVNKGRVTRLKKSLVESSSSVVPGTPSIRHNPEFTTMEPGSRFGFQAPTLRAVPQRESTTSPPHSGHISGLTQYHSSYSQSAASQVPMGSSQHHVLEMPPAPPRRSSHSTPQPIRHEAAIPRPHISRVYDPSSNVSETAALPRPHPSHEASHSTTVSNRHRGVVQAAPSSNSNDSDAESEIKDTDDSSSKGSRSDGSGDDDERGSEAPEAADADDVSRPLFRPQSPALEKDFDISPDEDERRALAVVHGYSQGNGRGRRVPGAAMITLGTSGDSSYNILENHHRRNGAPRPPDPEVLKAIQSGSQPAQRSRSASVSISGSHVRRLSQRSENQIRGHSTQLQFYPPVWRDILEIAKAKFRLYLTSVKPFPNRGEGVDEAAECLLEAVAEHRDAVKKVEPGYWEEYKDDMSVLVFEDASSFRGDLKTLARQIVETEYDIFFPTDVGHNSQGALQYTTERIRLYLHRGRFLRDENVDAEGHTKNIQHKAIAALVRAFYYQKKKMGQLFPDEFGETIPNHAVSLACCAIMCCLQEWESGQRVSIQFTGEAFNHHNDKILETITEVEAHAYHGRSYRDAKKMWATSGTVYSGPGGAHVIQNNFDAILD